MQRYQGTSITEPPTFVGVAGKAWRVRMPAPGKRNLKDHDATVDMIIVQANGAHPLWDHWCVSVIHLRPIEGVTPADIRCAGATHELIILALNPEQPLPSRLEADDSWRLHWLRPVDVVEQFTAKDDAVAQRICELAVRAIVDGYGSPDWDWRPWWKNAVATTARHYAEGQHDVGGLQ